MFLDLGTVVFDFRVEPLQQALQLVLRRRPSCLIGLAQDPLQLREDLLMDMLELLAFLLDLSHPSSETCGFLFL
jgi:hypothetical protein